MEKQERVFNLPGVIFWLVLVLGVIHAFRTYILSPEGDLSVLAALSFVPSRLTATFDPEGVAAALRAIALRGDWSFEFAEVFADGPFHTWTFVSYSLLHVDWTHFGLNAIWLVAFGAPVARRFGALRFLALFCATALSGMAVHYALHAYDPVPVIGASASVSGAMGAALRFVFQPGAPLGRALSMRPDEETPYRQPALPLSHLLRDRRVLTFILFWFVMNFVFGIAAQPLGLSDGSVAWEAHVGGFLGGLALFSLFDPKSPDFEGEAAERSM